MEKFCRAWQSSDELALPDGIGKNARIESRRSSLIPQAQTAWVLFALAAVWFALFFRLGNLPLLQPDEGRNAEVAREMNESGAWLSPTYNDLAYLDKPAFFFKAVALSLAAFGNNETAARIPSAMFGLALLAMTFLFCRRVYGTRCAVMAVIIIATMPLYAVFSRTVIFDMTLAFFVSAAIFAGYCAEEFEGKSRRNWYLLGALASGFATLVKGPVGFLIPSLVLFVFHRIEGRRGVWKRFFAPLNLLVFFGVTLPWFIGLSLQHPDFPYYGLIEESFHRFTTVKFHRTQPFYFYALIVAGLFLPWSFLLPEAGVAAWKNRRQMTSADRLCLVWAVVVVVFFSLSKSKLPGYILSTTVAAGILLARIFERGITHPDGKAMRIIGRAAITLTVLCLVVAGAGMYLSTHLKPLAGPMGLPPDDAEELGHHFTPAIILMLVFSVLGLLARFRRDASLTFVFFSLLTLLVFVTSLGSVELVFKAKSARVLAQQIPSLPPQTELVCLECYPPGLPFYLGRTATLISTDGHELTSNYILFRLKNDPAWPTNMVATTNLDRWLSQQKRPVYLITNARKRLRLEALAGVQKTNIQTLPSIYLGVLIPAP